MHRWQRIPVPLRGIDKSRIEPEMSSQTGVSPWMQNLLPLEGRLEARRTDENIPTATEFKELFEFGDQTGTQRFIAIGTDNDLYEINDDLSVTSLGTIVGDSTNAWMVTLGGSGLNRVYATQGHRTGVQTLSNLWNWDGTTFQQIPATGFSRLDANCLLAYKGHLLLADIIERLDPNSDETFPYRVRWSHPLDPTEFVVQDTNRAGYVDLVEDRNNSRILNMLPLREVIAVYKEDCIYNMTFKGILGFVPQITAADRGLIGPKAVAPVLDGNKHLVVSSDNIYLYNGFSFDFPAIGDPIQDWFFEELDWTRRDQVRVTSVPHRYEAWISYPTKDDEDMPITRTLVWNWKYNGWFPQTMNYRSLYLSKLFFDTPTFLGSRNGNNGLFKILEGDGVVSTLYDIPLQRIEEPAFGEFKMYRIQNMTLDTEGDWMATLRATNCLAEGKPYYIVSGTAAVGIPHTDRNGIKRIDFQRSDYMKYYGVRLESSAVDPLVGDPPILHEINIELDISGVEQ